MMSTYPTRAPIILHVPNSSGVNCLVTIIVKIKPVNTLVKPIRNEIKPVYVTLIFDNYFST